VAFLRQDIEEKRNKRFVLLTMLPLLVVLLGATFYHQAGAAFKPDQIKAAYLYNLPNFVRWQNRHDDGPFVVAIIGSSQIATYLKLLTKGETIMGRPIEVRFFEDSKDLKEAQMVFVSNSVEDAIGPKQLTKMASQGILTVGESLEFLKKGGMVGLVTNGNRIGIAINDSMAKLADISFNSKILKVAKIYHIEAGEGNLEK